MLAGTSTTSSLTPFRWLISAFAFVLSLNAWGEGRQGRVLWVDQRGATEYSSIAAAVAEVAPGDTIQLVPGSGPYREQLIIKTSGTAAAPITFDGAGETVTGLDPVTFVEAEDGMSYADLTPYFSGKVRPRGYETVDGRWINKKLPAALPFVLTYRGNRVRQDRLTGGLDSYAILSEDRNRLVLLPGVMTQGWEISTRGSTVGIKDVSHHVYRNLVASGALNDGYNLHGSGTNIEFQNIVGCNNFDEGFSAHDTMSCSIENGRFFGNDNGIVNVNQSVMVARFVACYDNLGLGIYFREASAELINVDSHGNGTTQFLLTDGASVEVRRLTLVAPVWKENPWLPTQESRDSATSSVLEVLSESVLRGEQPILF